MWFLSPEEGNHSKPLTYRAPSWSWASVDGRISYQTPVSWVGSSCIELKQALVKFKGADPMGEVTSGALILYAHVQCLSTQNGQSWEELLPKNAEGFNTYMTIMLDFGGLKDFKHLWLLYVTEGEGLTLKRAPTVMETYERVGVFRKIGVEETKQY